MPEGKTLASGSNDGTALIWDLTVPKPVAPIKAPWRHVLVFPIGTSASIFGPSARKPVAMITNRDVRGRSGQQVAAKLLVDEPTERLVGVEGGDHVVAITPRISISEVVVHAVAVGIPGEVQPVPAPALTVLGAGEEAVDDA